MAEEGLTQSVLDKFRAKLKARSVLHAPELIDEVVEVALQVSSNKHIRAAIKLVSGLAMSLRNTTAEFLDLLDEVEDQLELMNVYKQIQDFLQEELDNRATKQQNNHMDEELKVLISNMWCIYRSLDSSLRSELGLHPAIRVSLGQALANAAYVLNELGEETTEGEDDESQVQDQV